MLSKCKKTVIAWRSLGTKRQCLCVETAVWFAKADDCVSFCPCDKYWSVKKRNHSMKDQYYKFKYEVITTTVMVLINRYLKWNENYDQEEEELSVMP